MDELTPAAKTYVRATVVAMSLYMGALVQWGMSAWFALPSPDIVVRATMVLTSAAIVVHLWTLLRLVQRSDEFMRTVMAKRLLTASMIVIGCVTIWGLLQIAGWARPFPLPLIYILFFCVHAALIPFINANRP